MGTVPSLTSQVLELRGVWGLGFRLEGLGFRALGVRAWGLGFWDVLGGGLGPKGLELRA